MDILVIGESDDIIMATSDLCAAVECIIEYVQLGLNPSMVILNNSIKEAV